MAFIECDDYKGPDRRKADLMSESQFAGPVDRIAESETFRGMREELRSNTEKTEKVYDTIIAAEGAFKVLGTISKIWVVMMKVVAATIATWITVETFFRHHPPKG